MSHAYSIRKMAHFNLASHKPKVQLSAPTENIHWIKDDSANSKIRCSHGTIVGTQITWKFFYKSPLNSEYLWHRAWLAINKTQKYFLLPNIQFAENFILMFVFSSRAKNDKKKFMTKFDETRVISYKNVSQVPCETLATHCFLTDQLKHKTVIKKSCRTSSANPQQIYAH